MKQGLRRKVNFLVSNSLKNETRCHEDSYFTMSTWLKNELGREDSSFTMSTSLKNETIHYEDNYFIVSTSLKNKSNPFLNSSV